MEKNETQRETIKNNIEKTTTEMQKKFQPYGSS